MSPKSPAFGPAIFFSLAVVLGGYFVFAAVQGEYGVINRIQIDAEAAVLRTQRDALQAELTIVTNRTMRLSDYYLDLDLLEEQARQTLGLLRADEIILR